MKNREVDVFVDNYIACRYQVYKNKPQLQMIANLAQPMEVAFMMRKQDIALQQSLNQALMSMWNDGSLYAIKMKYLAPIGIQPQRNE